MLSKPIEEVIMENGQFCGVKSEGEVCYGNLKIYKTRLSRARWSLEILLISRTRSRKSAKWCESFAS